MLTWHYLTRVSYDSMLISEKTSDRLFFIKDTKQIYCGTNVFKELMLLYNIEPTTRIEGRLYVNASTLEGKIWNRSKWVTVIKPIKNTSITDEYVDKSNISSLIYDSTYNVFKVIMSDGTEDAIEFDNVLIDLLYDNINGEFILEYESCSLSNLHKKIYISDFINSISYNDGNIIINLYGNSEPLYIDAYNIINNSNYDIISITITGNSFIAESMTASNANNIMIYNNKMYAVSNTSKANYSPIVTLTSDTDVVETTSSEEATNDATTDISSTLLAIIENKMNKVGAGHTNEIIVADSTGDAKASGVKISTDIISSIPNHSAVATEKAIVDYVEKTAIKRANICTSNNIKDSNENASDENVVSEKALLKSISWTVL